ncbi:hypothetical protein DITRI_Ditri03aG0086900 [Diplodiscus trichospermus]
MEINSQPSTSGPMINSQKVEWCGGDILFDSQAWLGSDCEDEFFSAIGKDDNSEISGSPSQRSCFIESPTFIKAITEQKKQLMELFQDPFWNALLDQHHNVVSIYREELVQLFQDWSLSEQNMMDHSSLSKNSCIVNGKSVEPSVIELPWEITGLALNISRENSMDGNERAQKYKFKSREKTETGTDTGCCIPSFPDNWVYKEKETKW